MDKDFNTYCWAKGSESQFQMSKDSNFVEQAPNLDQIWVDKQLKYAKTKTAKGYTSDKSIASLNKNATRRRGRPPKSAKKKLNISAPDQVGA